MKGSENDNVYSFLRSVEIKCISDQDAWKLYRSRPMSELYTFLQVLNTDIEHCESDMDEFVNVLKSLRSRESQQDEQDRKEEERFQKAYLTSHAEWHDLVARAVVIYHIIRLKRTDPSMDLGPRIPTGSKLPRAGVPHEAVLAIAKQLRRSNREQFFSTDDFLKWCGKVVLKSESSARNYLEKTGCLVTVRQGKTGGGVERTIEAILSYADTE